MDKMSIYNASRAVPQEAQKKITGGRLSGMTDINPLWRVKKLTELFGPAGIGWKFDPPVFEEKPGVNGEVMVHCFTCLYIRQDEDTTWSAPIPGVGGSMLITTEKNGQRTDDEAYKKAYTDAQSVACKALGIGADVYWDRDQTKYSSEKSAVQPAQEPPQKSKPKRPEPAQQPALVCACCGKPLQPVSYKNRTVEPEETAKSTKKRFGRILCWNCAQKQPKENGGMTHA